MNNWKTYHILWTFALLSFIMSIFEYFVSDNSSIDINVHDTYFVFAHFHISILNAIVFLVFGAIYYFFERINFELITSLTKTHVGITCFSFVAYYFGGTIISLLQSNNSDFPLFDDVSNYNIYISLLILIVVIAQLLFILNVVFSGIRHFLRTW